MPKPAQGTQRALAGAEVRGRGLLQAVEIVEDPDTLARYPEAPASPTG